MTHAIAQIIYGVPLQDQKGNIPRSDDLEFEISRQTPGFLQFYSNLGVPRAFGVLLGSFPECDYYTEVTQLSLVPTLAQLQQFDELLAQLPPIVRKEVLMFGLPRVIFLWSTAHS